jgi:hydrogenase expression/formation protein HypC
MQVLQVRGERARVQGRGRVEDIDTRLVGGCAAGQWLLIFQGAARERLDPARAAEIDRALDLLEAGLAGDATAAQADPGFTLPSAMSAAELAALTQPPAPGGSR